MVAVARLPVRMTTEAFLDWDAGDGLRYELVDGMPCAMAPPSVVHGLLQGELGSVIRNHLRQARPECRVIVNPGVIPRLMSAHNMRIPDLAVTCMPVRPGQVVLEAPVLLVEILSPGNRAQSWANVWTYTSIPTVVEILVLHSTRMEAEILRRSADGGWPERTEIVAEGELELRSIGLVVAFAALYQGAG